MKNWEDIGCKICRESFYSLIDKPNVIGENEERWSKLRKCNYCCTFWEETPWKFYEVGDDIIKEFYPEVYKKEFRK